MATLLQILFLLGSVGWLIWPALAVVICGLGALAVVVIVGPILVALRTIQGPQSPFWRKTVEAWEKAGARQRLRDQPLTEEERQMLQGFSYQYAKERGWTRRRPGRRPSVPKTQLEKRLIEYRQRRAAEAELEVADASRKAMTYREPKKAISSPSPAAVAELKAAEETGVKKTATDYSALIAITKQARQLAMERQTKKVVERRTNLSKDEDS